MIILSPAELQVKVSQLVKDEVDNLSPSTGGENKFAYPELIRKTYRDVSPIWSSNGEWMPVTDSLIDLIAKAQLYGLFPEDYHSTSIKEIVLAFAADTTGTGTKKDALMWSKADLLLTDAFIGIIRDIKLGRLPNDSITMRKDSVLPGDFYSQQYDRIQKQGLASTINSLEPQHKRYHQLKAGIKRFLDSVDYRNFTKVPYPEKNKTVFHQALQKRLYEAGFIKNDSTSVDSATLAKAIHQFQQQKGITADGRAGEMTVRAMNTDDRERFIRIAISLDKYKMLPSRMPKKYIWVNVSSNFLQLVDDDTVRLQSKVITGKLKTRTPVLTSDITQLITYPQWVPPPSIVLKEILPAVKRNPGYLAKKGFTLVDSKGNEIDPYSVDWTKYSKGIPYRIIQGSGDANALGIMKFVFANKYSVYLHDTNQRYLFAANMRSLSHGCVRVQEWEKLVYYIIKNDSLHSTGGNYTRADSVRRWLGNKQKRSISIHNKIPVFLRYITCEGIDGKITFYDDVYAEDKYLREKYFASK